MTPQPLWRPSEAAVEQATITRYARWVAERHGVDVTGSYDALWRWSVADLEAFWASIWEFFGVVSDAGYEHVLASREMPGARWFTGARLSYPEHIFRDRDDDAVALRHASELRELDAWTWGRLRAETARVASALRALGVGPGDRVAAYLPNVPETVAAFLATASLGATWSSAAPEFGAQSVIDRFAQIEPKVLLAVDGYRYGGKDFDRAQAVDRIAAALPGEPAVVRLGYLDGTGWPADFGPRIRDGELRFARVPFDHPLWILYSSGTTGLPKAIVQSHGGILLEQLKHHGLHVDARAGDRVFWFSTTGWMMWNFLVGVLLTDASVVLYDGNPFHPAPDVLWDLAERAGITTFGTSAAYLGACAKAGAQPRAGRELAGLRAVGSTGSPLPPESFAWVYEHLGPDLWLFSTSGGTDVCTAFVGGVPTLPVHAGELQARALGCDVQAWDEEGRPLTGQVGELVITQPMPSMPTGFWGDPGGERYRESYFATYPGVWRHGDWIEITERGTAIITGRSDSTINRGGVRMGTSEIYRAVLALDEVLDALVVDVDGRVALFVVLAGGAQADDELVRRVAAGIREQCSPRHVPDEVHAVPEVPRTLSGKLLEVPVKRILMGQDPASAASRESLANPAALDWFVDFAAAERARA
jgi:acetoacetyl-CoA synthetase